MDKDELEKRIANLQPIDATKPQDVADSAFKAPQTKPVLEKVQTKADPELTPTISFVEAFSSNLQLWWQQNVGKYFKGEEIESPVPKLPHLLLDWKWLLIGLAVLGVLYVLLRWIV